jgi:hypothetical protein
MHEKFIEAFERIETALQLPEQKPEAFHNYIKLFWDDCQKYIAADLQGPDYIIESLDEYRLHAKYKQLPKIGDVAPLIEKRIFPDADQAYSEACYNIGKESPDWSHDVVRETARAFSSNDLNSQTKGIRERFAGRYSDNIGQWLNGRRFAFDVPQIEYKGACPVSKVKEAVDRFRNKAGAPDYADFFYLTKSGTAAQVQYNAALKRMKAAKWWAEHVNSHGEEPQLPSPKGAVI